MYHHSHRYRPVGYRMVPHGTSTARHQCFYLAGLSGIRANFKSTSTVAGVAIGISALTIIFNIVEIVLIARKRMPPALYLSSTCIKTAIWIAVFIVEVIALGIPGIALSAVML